MDTYLISVIIFILIPFIVTYFDHIKDPYWKEYKVYKVISTPLLVIAYIIIRLISLPFMYIFQAFLEHQFRVSAAIGYSLVLAMDVSYWIIVEKKSLFSQEPVFYKIILLIFFELMLIVPLGILLYILATYGEMLLRVI